MKRQLTGPMVRYPRTDTEQMPSLPRGQGIGTDPAGVQRLGTQATTERGTIEHARS